MYYPCFCCCDKTCDEMPRPWTASQRKGFFGLHNRRGGVAAAVGSSENKQEERAGLYLLRARPQGHISSSKTSLKLHSIPGTAPLTGHQVFSYRKPVGIFLIQMNKYFLSKEAPLHLKILGSTKSKMSPKKKDIKGRRSHPYHVGGRQASCGLQA